MKKIPIGITNYRELKEKSYSVIDKSLMIKDFLDNGFKVTLATRPRRFGKTLNMSMMSEFFDVTKNSSEIFKDTDIIQTEYAKELNQWPTIFISFAGAKGTKKQLVKHIKLTIREEFERLSFIFTHMSEYENDDYIRITRNVRNVEDECLENIDDSLSFLMKMAEKYFHKQVMLFIDEYDTPFIEAHVNGYYSEVKDGLAGLLHNGLKLSNNLQYAFVTGIQRVAKENIFSDLNNPVVCTVKDEGYSQYFGFTENETSKFLEDYGLHLNAEVKKMYDGYRFGNLEIYNPWSIINFANKKVLDAYWINTSANKMIKNAMQKADSTFEDGFEKLLKQRYLDTQVLMETSFFEQSETKSLWGLFLNAGYLTIDTHIQRDYYRIKIPNQEVQTEFVSLTANYLMVSSSILEDLYFSLETANKEMFENTYRSFMMTYPSYYDLIDENSYHTMWIALSAGLSYQYEIMSNKEAGKGRCDLVLKSKNDKIPSYVLEFKYSKNEMNLQQLADHALSQIIINQYADGIEGRVIYIGLAHCKKEICMKWQQR